MIEIYSLGALQLLAKQQKSFWFLASPAATEGASAASAALAAAAALAASSE